MGIAASRVRASGPAVWRRVADRVRFSGVVTLAMLRMFEAEFRASMLRVVAYGCALAAMGLMVSEFATLPRGAVVAEAMPEWVEVGRPFPAFAMTMPEFDEAPRYAIWRHPNGGGRKDIFTFGDSAGGASAVVELYRPGSEPGTDPDVVTASIPELRLSGRPVMQTAIDTKFGDVAIDAFTDQAPGGERSCLRFWRGRRISRTPVCHVIVN